MGRNGLAAGLIKVLAVVIALLGLILTLGGAWLLALGGSAYYLIAGVALAASGILLFRLSPIGGYVYLATALLTVACGL